MWCSLSFPFEVVSLDSTLLSREVATPPTEPTAWTAGLTGWSRCLSADMLALALLVDLDSQPPDFF